MSLTKQDINELRGDLSPFLIHLTRTGTYKEWADIHGLSSDNNVTIDARQSLIDILQKSVLEARSPFGYFNYKVPYRGKNSQSQVKRSWLRSVCFTETPVDHIYVQCQSIKGRQLAFQPYGLAFFEESVRSANGNPVFYFESNNSNIRNSLDIMATLSNCQNFTSMMILYEAFGVPLYSYNSHVKEIDFRWEREWRVLGNFNFGLECDVAFGICPEPEIVAFETLVGRKFPFIDPRMPIGLIKHKLRQSSRLSKII